MIAHKLLSPGLSAARKLVPGFRPKEEDDSILVSSSKFIVKIAETRREHLKVQKLRWDVFHREFQKKKFPFGLDRDRFDSGADHLIVIDRKTGKIVGAYRAIVANDADSLYTASEFDLGAFTKTPGTKLELSRACIHREYRTGVVLTLLWRGIGEYMKRSGAAYLFGIPSAKTTDLDEIVAIYRYFQAAGRVDAAATVSPRATHRLPGFAEALARAEAAGPLDETTIAAKIPPLFHVYVRAGAVIVGEPALDRDFGCVDFFMALKCDEMSQLFKRKYFN